MLSNFKRMGIKSLAKRLLVLPGLLMAAFGAAVAGEALVLAQFMPAPVQTPVESAPLARPAAVEPVADIHPARRAIDVHPIYDDANGARVNLQRIDEATVQLKKDALGFPDWMAAIRSGAIKPRAGLLESDKMKVLDLDIVMKNTKEMPHVLFPHLSHTLWLDCSNCHPVPFVEKTGGNPVSMTEVFRGKYCGMCHDRVAFVTFYACTRCHSVPQPFKPEQ